MISKDKLIFDVASNDGDAVGAFLKSSDGTLITHTVVGGKKALDVNITNTVDVAIDHTTDSVKVGDGVDFLAVNADGSINSVVTATDLDIRNLVFATDKVDVSGSSVTVSATDLDIRNLIYSQDSIAIFGATGNQLAINADGSINAIVDVQLSNGSDKIEDSAHVSGDIGTYVLSVREDVLSSSTSAVGDYQSLKTDALGRLHAKHAAQSAVFGAVSVGNTATDLVATDLVNRTKILIQNLSTKKVYIGNSGVTTATGIELSGGSSAEFEVTENVNLYAIVATGTADVRIMEVA